MEHVLDKHQRGHFHAISPVDAIKDFCWHLVDVYLLFHYNTY